MTSHRSRRNCLGRGEHPCRYGGTNNGIIMNNLSASRRRSAAERNLPDHGNSSRQRLTDPAAELIYRARTQSTPRFGGNLIADNRGLASPVRLHGNSTIDQNTTTGNGTGGTHGRLASAGRNRVTSNRISSNTGVGVRSATPSAATRSSATHDWHRSARAADNQNTEPRRMRHATTRATPPAAAMACSTFLCWWGD